MTLLLSRHRRILAALVTATLGCVGAEETTWEEDLDGKADETKEILQGTFLSVAPDLAPGALARVTFQDGQYEWTTEACEGCDHRGRYKLSKVRVSDNDWSDFEDYGYNLYYVRLTDEHGRARGRYNVVPDWRTLRMGLVDGDGNFIDQAQTYELRRHGESVSFGESCRELECGAPFTCGEELVCVDLRPDECTPAGGACVPLSECAPPRYSDSLLCPGRTGVCCR